MAFLRRAVPWTVPIWWFKPQSCIGSTHPGFCLSCLLDTEWRALLFPCPVNSCLPFNLSSLVHELSWQAGLQCYTFSVLQTVLHAESQLPLLLMCARLIYACLRAGLCGTSCLMNKSVHSSSLGLCLLSWRPVSVWYCFLAACRTSFSLSCCAIVLAMNSCSYYLSEVFI